MDIKLIIQAIIKKWWLWVFIPIITGIISYFLLKKLPDEYVSTAQLSVGLMSENQLSLDDSKINYREVDLKFNSLMESVKSKWVINMVSYKLIIGELTGEQNFKTPEDKQNIFTKDVRTRLLVVFKEKYENLELLNNFVSEEQLAYDFLKFYKYDYESILEKLYVKRVNFTDYVTIDFLSDNPLLSAYVVNSVADEFIKYNNLVQSQSSSESINFFNTLIDKKKKEIDDATDLLSAYKATNEVFDYDVESQSKVNRIENYENLINDERRQLRSLQLSLENVDDRIKELKSSGNSSNNDSGRRKIIHYQNRINALNGLYVISDDENILDSLKYYRDQLSVEKRSLNTTSLNIDNKGLLNDLLEKKNNLEVQIRISNSSITGLQIKINELKTSASDLAPKLAKIEEQEKIIEALRGEYISIQEKLNDVKNTSMVWGNRVKIALRGQPSNEPVPTKKLIIFAFLILASFFICVASIFIMEVLNTSIRDTERFARIINLPLLGTINTVDAKNVDFTKLFEQKSNNKSIEEYKHALRKIRYEIESSDGKIMLFTSLKAGEGKSSICLALAHSLSKINKRVLVIDANFKNNYISRYCINSLNKDGNKTPDLVLNRIDKYSSQEIVSKTIKHNGVATIPCLIDHSSPSEIFNLSNFNKKLVELKTVYDNILIEAPSINDYSDAKELYNIVDKAFMIVSSKTSIKQNDQESLKFIKENTGKLLGCVLNFYSAPKL